VGWVAAVEVESCACLLLLLLLLLLEASPRDVILRV
jgi:hypothetical protein